MKMQKMAMKAALMNMVQVLRQAEKAALRSSMNGKNGVPMEEEESEPPSMHMNGDEMPMEEMTEPVDEVMSEILDSTNKPQAHSTGMPLDQDAKSQPMQTLKDLEHPVQDEVEDPHADKSEEPMRPKFKTRMNMTPKAEVTVMAAVEKPKRGRPKSKK